ncbi:MAG: hypothetical protein M3O71_15590 [Bacteroidota bacterium]|nr:hypothetical protein [Bacteroidota bacterium]
MNPKEKNNPSYPRLIRVCGWIGIIIVAVLILSYFLSLISVVANSYILAEENPWSLLRIIKRTVVLDALFVALFLSICLSVRKKIVVLYLRKFHSNVEIISPAHLGGLGKGIRLVTLQDQSFPSMASTRKDKIVAYLVMFFIFIAGILLTYYMTIGDIEEVSEDNEFMFTIAYTIILFALWLGLTMLTFMLFYIIKRNISKVIRITKEKDITGAANQIGAMNSVIKRPALMAGRATIIETANNLWRETVARILLKCTIVIVDISQITTNISWEINECLVRKIPLVLICSEETNIPDIHLPAHVPLLRFPGQDDPDLAAFRSQLTETSTDYTHRPQSSSPENYYYFKRWLFYFFLYLLSVGFSTLIIWIMVYIYDSNYT